VDPADLEVSLTKGQLTIRGTLKDAAPEGGEVVCHRKERPAGSFARTFPLPFEVEEGKISAKYETGVYQRSFALGRDIDDAAVKARLRDGVLEIELPKAKEARPRRIAVEA
jgi:HSP20 family molecular chaperone IbpA